MKSILLSTMMVLPLALKASAGNPITVDFKAIPLPAALTRFQDASGLRLAFASDLVKDAEPVTLSAKDESADSVLHRILRPRGLEFIYTAETMAAIVRADSDMAMAKAAGRAIRTLARLARKIDSAKQAGDEIVMPEWEDADDRAMAEAVIDGAGACLFFGEQRMMPGAACARLLAVYDRDVRVGACVAAAECELRQLEDRDAIIASVTETLADEESAVRAAGLVAMSCLRACYGRQWEVDANQATAAGAKDAAPEVRLAVAMMAMLNRECDPDLDCVAALRSDPAAAARCMAWAAWGQRRGAREAPDGLAAAILAERNPVAKIVICLLSPLMSERRDRTVELWKLLQPADDRLLKLCEPAFNKKVDLLGALNALIASGKPSHKVLAAGGMLAFLLGGPIDDDRYRPGLLKLAGHADSGSPWPRFTGIAACGVCPDDAAQARTLAALTSPDELDRLAALIGCTRRAEPAMPSPHADALAKLLDSPRYLEWNLAAEALRRGSPFEGQLADFQAEAKRNPRSRRARSLLESLCRASETRYGPAALLDKRRQAILLAVLESRNTELQTAFVTAAEFCRVPNLLGRLIRDCAPRTLFALVDVVGLDSLAGRELAAHAIIERLGAIFEAGGPNALAAMKAFAILIKKSDSTLAKDDLRAPALALLDWMLSVRVPPEPARDDAAAACDLLAALLEGQLILNARWNDLPPATRSAAVRILGCAAMKPLRHQVAKLLALCHNRLNFADPGNADPAMVAAMEGARATIMGNGTAEDQVTVLMSMARKCRPGGSAACAEASAELQKRLMAGDVPAPLRCSSLHAIPADSLSPDFLQYLMKQVLGRKEDVEFREGAACALAMAPQCLGELVPALVRLEQAGRPGFDPARVLGNLAATMRYRLPRAADGSAAPPAWFPQLAALGRGVMNDEKRPVYLRDSGMQVLALASGKQAAAELEAIALNDTLADGLRAAASEAAHLANPETAIYRSLLGRYAAMKSDLRRLLAMAAVKSADAPGAGQFIIRYLKDPEALHRAGILYSELPATQEFIDALKELAGDEQLAPHVQKAIRRLERLKPKNSAPAPRGFD